jgi:hypothetical protein
MEFSTCKELKKLWMFSADIENLNGLSDLVNLAEIDLEDCRKLVSVDGISRKNISLQTVHLTNCKRLRNVDALTILPNLKRLTFYQIPELSSLKFLDSLHKLEDLRMHPTKVGVVNKDYYPLVAKLKQLNKLELLKDWKPFKWLFR